MSSNRNAGALVGGSLLIVFGALALLGELFSGFHFWNAFWPFLIIGVGAIFFVGVAAGGKSVSGLAIPASIITTNGLLLLYQNLTGHWESWSYGWTIILMSVGLGIFIMGAVQGDMARRRAGLRVLWIGLILFVVLGAFFEMIFTSGMPFGLRQIFFPIALILLGVYLVLVRTGLLSRRESPNLTSNPTTNPPTAHTPEEK